MRLAPVIALAGLLCLGAVGCKDKVPDEKELKSSFQNRKTDMSAMTPEQRARVQQYMGGAKLPQSAVGSGQAAPR